MQLNAHELDLYLSKLDYIGDTLVTFKDKFACHSIQGRLTNVWHNKLNVILIAE